MPDDIKNISTKVEKVQKKKIPIMTSMADLKHVHKQYNKNKDEWRLLLSAYKGARTLVEQGFLIRNERESKENYDRRLLESYGLSYSKSIVELLNFYLFQKPVQRKLGTLETDSLWMLFSKDCNLNGKNIDDFLTEQGKYSSIFGHVGILIDKPSISDNSLKTKEDEIIKNIYPYICAYFPTAILDWIFEADDYNRQELIYLKLLDNDGSYRIWTKTEWQIWKDPRQEDEDMQIQISNQQKQQVADEKMNAVLVAKGDNKLGKIPFIWLYNMESEIRNIGVSDIHDVARIDVSILRNLSQGEEIINYAAFPMMRKPMQDTKLDSNTPKTDEVGVTAVLEFDPDKPDSKPDWLDSSVGEPLNAISNWIDKKINEIYRVSNAGGVQATEVSSSPKSGIALKTEFMLLNSKLASKAANLEHAEEQIIIIWLMWQNLSEMEKEISVSRERSYDVENLAADLENAITSTTLVLSKTFSKQIQKNIVKQMLPTLDEKTANTIGKEIDENVDKEAELGAYFDQNQQFDENGNPIQQFDEDGNPVSTNTATTTTTTTTTTI